MVYRPTHRLGKKLARPDAIKLAFHRYVDIGQLPAPPTDFGHENLVTDWGMLLNDRIGDCAIAGALHETMLWNDEAKHQVPINDWCAVENYSAVTGYTPGPELENPQAPANPTDRGTDVPQLISYRRTRGLLDAAGNRHRIVAALALEPGNWDQLHYAAYYFDGVGVGIRVPQQWEEGFQPGGETVWDSIPSPHFVGGHYITCVAWRDNMPVLVTWGDTVRMTQAGYRLASDETFAYLTYEKLIAGVDLEGFNARELMHDLPLLADIT